MIGRLALILAVLVASVLVAGAGARRSTGRLLDGNHDPKKRGPGNGGSLL